MRKLSKESKREIRKHNFEYEVGKWNETGNDIIALAKKMCQIMMDMTDFTKGRGPYKTTTDVVRAAQEISENGGRLNELARQIGNESMESITKKDLFAYLERVTLFCHQLNVTSKVKADIQVVGDELRTGGLEAATSLIQNAKNLLNAIILAVKSAYIAGTQCQLMFGDYDFLCGGQWHFVNEDDLSSSDCGELRATRPLSLMDTLSMDPEQLETEQRIKTALKQIMQSVDLDDVTSQDIRRRLSGQISVELRRYKEFIDHQMLVILGQLDSPSKIFEYLYLGTEWNASNWEELRANGVQYILNVTKEVDNFFPVHFTYLKIWVSDEATTELLMHWQRTYDFIKEAKEKDAKVLVHCKKGISRSASTVIAYAMKAYGWGLDEALEYVKRRRDCITPNPGFMEQLDTFHGMLQASNNRHSAVFSAI